MYCRIVIGEARVSQDAWKVEEFVTFECSAFYFKEPAQYNLDVVAFSFVL